MVRDGRATVHSIISRKVTITGFDLTNYRQCMQKWNQAITTMHDQCQEIGKERCLMVSSVLRSPETAFKLSLSARALLGSLRAARASTQKIDGKDFRVPRYPVE